MKCLKFRAVQLIFAWVSLLMILVSVLLMCAASLPSIRKYPPRRDSFHKVEYFFCACFTLEFLMRLIFCPSKVAFVKQLMTWIDLISLMPYYRKIIFQTNDFDFLRAIRLIRLFRAFRFFKFTNGLQIIVQSLKASFRELLLLVIILIIPVVLFASFVYEMEKDEQPVRFNSIPHTFWWAVITMTTVGYGDMTPKTMFGQFIGSVCAICGVLIIGLPVSVIGNNFSTYYEHAQARLSLPKKKRRLIMGDANRLAMLQGQSSSSGDHESVSIDLNTNDSNGADDISRNYKRHHPRSRNTIFARGDVYIGQSKAKNPDLSPPLESNGEELEYVNAVVVDQIERKELSDNQVESKESKFTLIKSTHKETTEEKDLGVNSEYINCKYNKNNTNFTAEKQRKVPYGIKSKSLVDLQSVNHSHPPSSNTCTSPRPRGTCSFRSSRVSPSPEEESKNVEHLAHTTRYNHSLTLPPLTHAKSIDWNDVHKNKTYYTGENVQVIKSDDKLYTEKKSGRKLMHKNGDVSYG